MNRRRVIINLILAFVLTPLIFFVKNYIELDIYHDQSIFHGAAMEYTLLMPYVTFLILPLLFLIFVLLPYNLIIVHKIKNSTKLPLLHKILWCEFVVTAAFCLIGIFNNVWLFPIWKNLIYLVYFLPYSISFSLSIHFLADRVNTKSTITTQEVLVN